MSKAVRIGIVGCGAIGTSLAKFVRRSLRGKAVLAAVYDTDRDKARALAGRMRAPGLCVRDLDALIARATVVIEAASARASGAIARAALGEGRQVLVMSVGGIVDSVAQLERLCRSRGGTLYVPSGALCGVDALKAARLGGLRSVTLITRKNPRAFKGVAYLHRRGVKLEGMRRETVLFSGSAREAVKHFPQNINVAAVLSIAGLGAARTRVRIVAVPGLARNVHEVQIDSRAGRVVTRTENVLHPENPKTSYLAVLSAAATLQQILGPVRTGT